MILEKINLFRCVVIIIVQVLNEATHANEIKKIHGTTPNYGKNDILYLALDYL